ncbi:MAG: Kelch repeat-containing protein [Bacillota bacterium]
MPISVNVGGGYRIASNIHTRVNGTWRKASQVWIRINGVWKQVWTMTGFKIKANMNTPRAWHYVESVGNYVYAIGGYSGAMADGYESKDNERYDTTTNTWSYMANMTYRKLNGASFVLNNEIYMQGGNADYYQGVIYNPANNTYREYKPTVSGEAQFSGAIGSYGYTAGGFDRGPYTSTFQYNPATNYSSSMQGMPTALATGASAVVNDSLYTIGGRDRSGVWTTYVYRFTPSSNTWVQMASTPTANERPCAWVIGGKIYLYRLSNQLDVYDPGANTWRTTGDGSLSGQAIYGTKAAVVGSKAYIPGGLNANNGVISNQLLEYTVPQGG